mmetsp:Transcript_27578/g.51187  ORF Transcript_27578/g.51187 Transcript_27578/m.51187 type:complete len:240 (-) Transcript_27578:455-1174(-)
MLLQLWHKQKGPEKPPALLFVHRDLSCLTGLCFAVGSFHPLTQLLQQHVEDRNKNDANHGCGQHAAKHGNTNGLLAGCASAICRQQWHHTQQEGQRRHHHRAETLAGGLDSSFLDAQASRPPLHRKFHDENGVFGGQTNQHDHPDLGVEVHISTRHKHRSQRTKQRHRNRKQNTQRHGPTLILRNKEQIGKNHRHDQNNHNKPASGLLLLRRTSPFKAISWRQSVGCFFFQYTDCITGG